MLGVHRRMSGTRQHHVVPISDRAAAEATLLLDKICPKHGHVVALFDMECCELLCALCVPYHAEHVAQIKPLSETALHCRAQLVKWEARIEKWRQCIRGTSDSCSEPSKLVGEEKRRISTEIEISFQKACEFA